MSRIMVFGGNGFIGRNLAALLVKRGESVISFDLQMPARPEDGITYLFGDFFDDQTLEKSMDGIDIVYHCICTINPGNSELKYFQGYHKDFIQTVKLIEIAKRKKIKVIFLSSGGTVYGKQEKLPISEECITKPMNHYGNLKVCIENTIRIFNQLDGTNMKIARIANPYGPGQDYGKGVGFIDAVLKCGLRKQTVKVWGKGNVVRDYIYIDDVCEMLYEMAVYTGKIEIFNLGTGEGKSQKDIIRIAKEWFPELKIEYLRERNVDVPENVLDNRKIKQIYHKKLTELSAGMEKYYKYLVQFGKIGENV